LTSDTIIWRGGLAIPICQLCKAKIESPKHLVADISFLCMVWSLLAQKYLPRINQTTSSTKIKLWWTATIGPNTSRTSRKRAEMVTYVVSNLWKERCRRVFDNKTQTPI
jgi:hypothetical protein